jgi:hypothetical protein
MTPGPRPRWIVATVFALVVMITWTLVAKYLAPLLFDLALALQGDDGGSGGSGGGGALAGAGVMWDLWPLAHIALAVGLWRRHRLVWIYGVSLALAESAVVLTKFYFFLRAPEWTFWKLLWFTNKVYVLLFFLCLLYVLLGPGRRELGGRLVASPAGRREGGA